LDIFQGKSQAYLDIIQGKNQVYLDIIQGNRYYNWVFSKVKGGIIIYLKK